MQLNEKSLSMLKLILLVALGMWACLSFVRVISVTISDKGATDFHSYWYSGIFVRQGIDPYYAFYHDTQLPYPITFIDGEVIKEFPGSNAALAKTPANTAPVVLFMTLFSYLSWQKAKLVWLLCNMFLVAAILWLTFKVYHGLAGIGLFEKCFIILSFLSMLATRNVANNGQTSFMIFALMLLALLAMDQNPVVAGVALGLALSKYSLALPLFLFFVIKRKELILIISLLVQLAGAIILALITNTGPLQILLECINMLRIHVDEPGIHLARLFASSSFLTVPVLIIFTVFTWGSIIYWYRKYGVRLVSPAKKFSELLILGILFLWTLLVAYHREYDAILFILPVTSMVVGLRSEHWSGLSKNGLAVFLVASIAWLSRPNAISLSYLPRFIAEQWMAFSLAIVTIILFAQLIVMVFLLYQIKNEQLRFSPG